MLEQILPPQAVVAATRGDLREAELFAAERPAVANAVEKRRLEFVTGRACARRALAKLGREPAAIPPGPKGEPIWPPGVVGSITHCQGYRACALASGEELAAIGVDAEPNAPLPPALLADIALPAERRRLREAALSAPQVNWDRLLFCAKEAVYKAWFPLAERWLGFEDAELSFGPGGTFTARLLVPGPSVGGAELTGFDGRWATAGGLLLAAVTVPAADPPA